MKEKTKDMNTADKTMRDLVYGKIWTNLLIGNNDEKE
jgi:hypothetical protein